MPILERSEQQFYIPFANPNVADGRASETQTPKIYRRSERVRIRNSEMAETNLDVVGLQVDEKKVTDGKSHGYPNSKSAKP